MSTTRDWSAPAGRLNRAFTRSVIAPMAVALALCIGMVAVAVLWVGHAQNNASAAATTKLLRQILDIRSRNLGLTASDYAMWKEAFQHAHETFDPAWLDENVGIWVDRRFKIELTFVIGPAGRTIYGAVNGKRTDGDAAFFLDTGFASLLQASREAVPESSERHGLISTRFGPGLVAIATIMPQDKAIDLTPGQRSSLVFVRLLSDAAMREIGDIAGLTRLRLQSEPADAAAGVMTLRAKDGKPVASLRWQPERPGDALTRHLLPPLGLLALGLCLYACLAVRHLRKAATTLAASEARAQTLALHDALTGLPNRSLFREQLEAALALPNSAPALLCLDLDGFKEVNDTLGHAGGDTLLRVVATRLSAAAAEGQLVARLGGDEFAVLMRVGAVQEAEALARRLLLAMAEPVEIDGQDCRIGVSIGIAVAPAHGRTGDELARHADIALYDAKSSGRRTYSVFASQMNEHLAARVRLVAALRQALAHERFELAFQPQYELCSGDLVAVEALLRWTDPELGQVSPDVFIPLAEETGLIAPIGAWVLRRACAAALDWPGLRIAVNLSPVQFRDPDLVAEVSAILAESGLPPARLELEITESALFAEPDKARVKIEALRRLGISIAMDDFGTGYSSLSQLSRFPVDTLKIDQSFVRQLGTGGAADLIVRAVLGLGEGLGVNVVAEGVETDAQLAHLCSIGCPDGQGYLLGRPIGAGEVTGMLHPYRVASGARSSVKALVPALA